MSDKIGYNDDEIQPRVLDDAPNAYSGFCPISPVPKGRPRFARKGKFVQAYTPKETLEYETAVREWVRKDYGMLREPMDGPIFARYEFVMPRPKSKSRKQQLVDTKPDVDNLVKSFQDALDFKTKSHGKALGVLANDSRVTTVNATKRYARDGEKCGTFFSFARDGYKAVVFDNGNNDNRINDFIDPSILVFMLEEIEKHRMVASGITEILFVGSSSQLNSTDKKRIGKILKSSFPDLQRIITR